MCNFDHITALDQGITWLFVLQGYIVCHSQVACPGKSHLSGGRSGMGASLPEQRVAASIFFGRHLSTTPPHTTAIWTLEGYPVVFLLSSKSGGSEGIASNPSSGELQCGGQLHRGSPTKWVFRFLFIFSMFCGVKGFMVAGVQIMSGQVRLDLWLATGIMYTCTNLFHGRVVSD